MSTSTSLPQPPTSTTSTSPSTSQTLPLFPTLTPSQILLFQFSSWYPTFARISIKSKIIPLDDKPEFVRYLLSEGVVVPKGSGQESEEEDEEEDGEDDDGNKDARAPNDSDSDSDSDTETSPEQEAFAFPELDAMIRQTIEEYGAVFPKLNFSSPKDASWILPASSPLKCTAPVDVYLLLKSSDFINHDLDLDQVFQGCVNEDLVNGNPSGTEKGTEAMSNGSAQQYSYPNKYGYVPELVLRKWYAIDSSREFRCFVRNSRCIGISQRDRNFYDYMNDSETREKIRTTISQFWEKEIKPWWEQKDYIFDILLTRNLQRGHVIDFNPYAPYTDPLLFEYEELQNLVNQDGSRTTTSNPNSILPVLRVIDSPSHPVAARNAPANQHNMVPLEVLSLSNGRTVKEFVEVFQQEVLKSSAAGQSES